MPPPTRRIYPIPEATELLGGITRPTLYALIADGSLTRVHIGRRAFITANSIDTYLQQIEATAAAQVGA